MAASPVAYSWAFVVVLAIVRGQWTQYLDPTMPRASEQMAVGYYNQSIYLMYGPAIRSPPILTVNNVHCHTLSTGAATIRIPSR